VIFLAGAILMIFNLYMTMRGRETLRVRPPEVRATEVAA
jgi:cbb3-type cytochrome oxidase subunit 1